MNTYKHWLKINGYTSDENKQISEIETYLQKYPNSKVTIYIVERKDLEISGGEIRRKMREEVKEDWEIDN